MKTLLHSRSVAAFTLVEMLVSMAILAIILVVLAQVTAALQASVTQTTSAVHEFEAARDAFEVMTRRIGQATLNSYNDTAANTGQGAAVTGYTRASELRFISGPASIANASLANTAGPLFSSNTPYHPGHAIFFQAPLGKTSSANYASLTQAMNTCGYYVEYNADTNLGTGATSAGLNIVPSFIPATPRWRYRLMEMIEPSDSLSIYGYTSGANTNATASKSWTYNTMEWFQTPYSQRNSATSVDYLCAHPIADNILCVSFLPMVAPQNAQHPLQGGAVDGTSTDLMVSPDGNASYLYDTSPVLNGTPPVSQNQLPPLVYVLMIAVDEKSFFTYQAQRGTAAQSAPSTDLGIDSPGNNSFFTVSTYAQRTADIAQVTQALNAKHIRYRIFSTAVPLTAH